MLVCARKDKGEILLKIQNPSCETMDEMNIMHEMNEYKYEHTDYDEIIEGCRNHYCSDEWEDFIVKHLKKGNMRLVDRFIRLEVQAEKEMEPEDWEKVKVMSFKRYSKMKKFCSYIDLYIRIELLHLQHYGISNQKIDFLFKIVNDEIRRLKGWKRI